MKAAVLALVVLASGCAARRAYVERRDPAVAQQIEAERKYKAWCLWAVNDAQSTATADQKVKCYEHLLADQEWRDREREDAERSRATAAAVSAGLRGAGRSVQQATQAPAPRPVMTNCQQMPGTTSVNCYSY